MKDQRKTWWFVLPVHPESVRRASLVHHCKLVWTSKQYANTQQNYQTTLDRNYLPSFILEPWVLDPFMERCAISDLMIGDWKYPWRWVVLPMSNVAIFGSIPVVREEGAQHHPSFHFPSCSASKFQLFMSSPSSLASCNLESHVFFQVLEYFLYLKFIEK